ncbi:sigma-70 family RNA polymerase sigma factor [Alienimonas californiensis]|uniref:RNA polymerase sigma factor SigX n=1 Tax=Alienimonas californiensis TaxID=2527989 RepID=A0A517P7V2_9PLAN|nr:sigma-70 family RNA polymerase sigma factor [Alienimonas californiensis]QDT15433.1 RNA polymerase sigma factor SigX [Alienimonas californiensis]
MWPNSDETQQLLADAGRAEGPARTDARNDLMDRHRRSLERLVRMRLDRQVQRRVDASDVVQDVLLEAHKRLDDFLADGSMPFHLWLRQLARDRIIDMHRRHRVAAKRSVDREQSLTSGRPGDDDDDGVRLAAQLKDAELTPAAATIRKELEEKFVAALDELSEDDRDLLLMRHIEGLGNSEVAQALGLSQPAAGMRHLRALRRLRKVLGESAQP